MKVPRVIAAFFDREFLLWGLAPCGFALLVVGLFAVPNYLRANRLRDDAQSLKAITNERSSAQNNLRTLERMVSALRDERDRRCRPLCEGVEMDRLLSAITRTTDGINVREQSIRTGQIFPVDGLPEDFSVTRREVTVEMSGTFDAIFSVIHSAETVDQLVTPKAIELVVTATPIEQAQTGTAALRARIVFDEWFHLPTSHTPTGAASSPPLAMQGAVR